MTAVGVGKEQQDATRFILCALKLVDGEAYVESKFPGLGVSKEKFAEMENMTTDDAYDLLGIEYQPVVALDGAETTKSDYLLHRSSITDRMYITFDKTVTCNECNGCSKSDDQGIARGTALLELLPSRGKNSLVSLIRNETMSVTEDYKCSICGGESVSATIKLRFRQLPPFLFIHLNRVEDKDSEVQFPAKLTLTDADNHSEVYNLSAVVVFLGEDARGHYITYRFHHSRWWMCSDTFVTPCQLETVLSQTPYCLLYEKTVQTEPEKVQTTMSGVTHNNETPPFVPRRKRTRPSVVLTAALNEKLNQIYKCDQRWKHWRPLDSKANKNRYNSEKDKFAGYAGAICGVTQVFIKKQWWPLSQQFREGVIAENVKKEADRACSEKLKEMLASQWKTNCTTSGQTIHNHAPVNYQQIAETNTNNIHQIGDSHDDEKKGKGRGDGSALAVDDRQENAHFSTPSRRSAPSPHIPHPLGSPEAPIVLDDD